MKVLPQFLPRIQLPKLRRLRTSQARYGHEKLFDGDDQMFKSLVTEATSYAEYGVGSSTVWVAKNTGARIAGVDTSRYWIDKVLSDLNNEASGRLQLEHIDVGPLRSWGRPEGYSMRSNFLRYVEKPFEIEPEPNVVLVDGRFRVACFLTSLAKSVPATSIIFDDYIARPEYHLVEDYIRPEEVCGRQALFVVPESLDRESVLTDRDRFLMVID